ncbi:efflux RND transporter periplasmic adaptor subunit [uncultured Psychrosphaera sp.]|uniref:efflux RND transporter periplasmic adaptor subunit n=1 Tax=uncultured Psychrosphaera sp. TaxID=1403522 RepID=UPI00260FCFE6|nr:efflux RND transporter periplasmic adaptor subunit [uncultured Psychrosphaera sp.]
MFKKPVTWIVLLLVCMLVFVFWPVADISSAKKGADEPTVVETQAVQKQFLKDEIVALGTTQANESIILTSQSTDRVKSVHFDDSDSVKKGQLIVTLEHAQEQAELKELEIKFAEQKRQLQRLLDINKTSAPAESAIDSQKSLMESTQAQLSVAKIKLSEKFIYAPFAGKLGLRQISPGQLLTSNTEITTLDDLSEIKVEFELPEKFLNRVSFGQPVSAKNIAYPIAFKGKITSIASRLDKATRSFKVRAIFPNKQLKLRAGMLLQLIVETQSIEVLTVPETSIIPLNAEHYVYQVIDNKVHRVQVITGRRKPGIVEVVSGLVEGDVVVSQGVIKVREGSMVTTAEAMANTTATKE